MSIDRFLYLMEMADSGFSGLSAAYDSILGIFRAICMLIAIPSLINCFFGYKIQKFLITLSGIVAGGIFGFIFGLAVTQGEEAVGFLVMLLGAPLGGWLAYKLYRLGIFLSFWLYGTIFFMALFIVMQAYEIIPAAVMPGFIVGVLALVVQKSFVICATAISGGMSAGVFIGVMMGNSILGLLLGIGFSALGIYVQFRLEKKAAVAPAQAAVGPMPAQPAGPSGGSAVPGAGIQPPQSAAPAFSMPASTASTSAAPAFPAPKSAAPAPGLQPLGKTVPRTYCLRSGILVEEHSLFKDGNENVFASVKFRNVGEKPVIAVYYELRCRSVAGDELGSMERVLLDINIAPGESFSSGEPFRLTDYTIRLIEPRLTRVVTDDGESIRLTEEDIRRIPPQTELRGTLDEKLLELAGLDKDERYFFAELENGYWQCACGAIARAGDEACPHCGRNPAGMLRDNGSDIYQRVNDRVKAELDHAKGLAAKRELEAAREAIGRDMGLLQGFDRFQDLCDECADTLRTIAGRLSELAVAEEERKKINIGVGIIFGLVVVGLFALAMLEKFLASSSHPFLTILAMVGVVAAVVVVAIALAISKKEKSARAFPAAVRTAPAAPGPANSVPPQMSQPPIPPQNALDFQFCPMCSTKLPGSAKFCSKCGNRLDDE